MKLHDLSWTGWSLAALLYYATATAFVREAWAVQSFQAGVFALLAIHFASGYGSLCRTGALLLLLPLWGGLQLAAGWTSSAPDTREAILHWGALAAVFLIARRVGQDWLARRTFRTGFLGFAVLLAVLCVLQVFTSGGRVLWAFDSGYPNVFATFAYHNNYAQFAELALPVALWQALRAERNAWVSALAGGILYASVIASTSRAGAVLCTLELAGFAAIALARSRRRWLFAAIPLVSILFTLVVGWQEIGNRFRQQDPYGVRREYFQAAVEMITLRPAAGYGLGAFPRVADAFAVKDFPFYANHVHNDWLEFAADGGVLFSALVMAVFAMRVPAMFRHPWSLGLLAVMLHACVDYPFPRAAVSGWMFALLGILAGSSSDRRC